MNNRSWVCSMEVWFVHSECLQDVNVTFFVIHKYLRYQLCSQNGIQKTDHCKTANQIPIAHSNQTIFRTPARTCSPSCIVVFSITSYTPISQPSAPDSCCDHAFGKKRTAACLLRARGAACRRADVGYVRRELRSRICPFLVV